MQNFQIRIQDDTYNIIFEQKKVGHIQYSNQDQGYLVFPDGATYSGFFVSLDEAVTELIFHTYTRQNRKIANC